jgi:Flp pilus assembly protein TadG
MDMTKQSRRRIRDQRGFAMVYMAVTFAGLVLFSGLAVDTGRAYVVKAQLTKAVDGAALAAARSLNSGDPRKEAGEIFKANFPSGYMGTTSVTDPADADFFNVTTVAATGVNVVTVKAKAKLPTTFMALANVDDMTVSSSGEATRRMVDLSLVLDVSSSIGSGWPAVRDASRAFIDAFDASADRLALVTYGNGASVLDQMPASRGFNKSKLKSDVPQSLSPNSTAMVEGLYRGWDELRTVAKGQQSGLRVIVLFTDGASNSVPGNYDEAAGLARGLRTFDFPRNAADTEGQTHDTPQIQGLFNTNGGAQTPAFPSYTVDWRSTNPYPSIRWLPLQSFHGNHRSSGIKTSFPWQSSSLKVNGVAQSTRRGLRNRNPTTGRYPTEVWNINNAARNLLEIIGEEIRNDNSGDYPIRIYTIGMGKLVKMRLGTIPEQPEEILMRIANDKESQDFNSNQLEGEYYYAETAADVATAFQQLQNQIVRLSK